MIRKIIKRDSDVDDFNPVRITDAIWEACSAVGDKDLDEVHEMTGQVIQQIEDNLDYGEIPHVSDVQNTVEEVLMENGHYKTAKAYILYRQQHEDIRKVGGLLEGIEMIDKYLDRSDWKVKENSNMSYSLQGLNVYAKESIVSDYWLNKIYSPKIGNAHESGDIHIHDLGTLGPYCVGWDLKEILTKGFKGAEGKIESKPAKHFNVALMQIVNYLYTLQGEAAGAQAVSNFDTLLAPFISHDDLTYEQVKQQMQMFLYNMNVPTRVGFQTPFTNITMDLEPPKYMEDEAVIIGGKMTEDTYGDFQEEMDMLNRSFAEIMIDGDAKNRPFTFPIPTYNITEDFEWGNETLNPIWEMTAKFGIPYFSSYIGNDMDPEDARSMCCRLRLDNRKLRNRGGGLFGSNPKTGSIGVVTINLPRIGYKAPNEDEFFEMLDKRMDVAKESLIIKREVVERLTKQGLHPYSKFYLSDIENRFGEYWKNHFSTIGLVGMNDMLLNLKDTDIGTDEGIEFAEKVLVHMRDKLSDYQEETGDIFNLEATPAESTCYRLARLDKEEFNDIKVYNQIGDPDAKPYYTNSSQLPVGYTDDIFEELELQDSLQTKYTGGTVLHGFLGEKIDDIQVAKDLVRKIANNFELPYYTLTPTFSVCPQCGYIEGEKEECPDCGSKCEIYSRVVGYLRPVNQWNEGKSQEYEDREEFTVTQ